ncbi:shTK domain protein, partial [Ancylostoma duodenale]
GCVDKAIQCANDPSICRQVDMQAFVKENCQRTCGYCPTATTAASGVTVATTRAAGSSGGSCASAVDANLKYVLRYLRIMGEERILHQYLLPARDEKKQLR